MTYNYVWIQKLSGYSKILSESYCFECVTVFYTGDDKNSVFSLLFIFHSTGLNP